MNLDYFLTRQSANLMEDFVREINRGSALFLLYGETGVGKTRLLQQLKRKRLNQIKTRWLDCVDEISYPSDFIRNLKQGFEQADDNEVFFVDHCGVASESLRRLIFECWVSNGRAKNLNVIICVDNAEFEGFRQLAQEFDSPVKSFQLTACSANEVEAFIKQVLFSGQSQGDLSIPPPVYKQLKACRGVFAALIEVIKANTDSIELRPRTNATPRWPMMAAVGLTVIVLLSLLVSALIPNRTQPLIGIENTRLPENTPKREATKESKPVVNQQKEDDAVEATKLEAELEPVKQPTVATITASDWFRQTLQTDIAWIRDGAPTRGTIQLMSIGFNRFDPASFQDYLQELAGKGVDTKAIRIFETRAGERKVYSVIYGEYATRRQASEAMLSLPSALSGHKPISRSTGGIWKEIGTLVNN